MRTNPDGDDLGHRVVRSAVLHRQHVSVPHLGRPDVHNWNRDVIHHILGVFHALEVQHVRLLCINGNVIRINEHD